MGKIVSIKEWKLKKGINKEKNNTMTHDEILLGQMSFQQLVTECSTIVSQLNADVLNKDLARRSKLVINEFRNRIRPSTEDINKNLSSFE